MFVVDYLKRFRSFLSVLFAIFFLFSLCYGADGSGFSAFDDLPIAVLINSPLYESRVSAIEIALIQMGGHYEVYMAFNGEFPEPDSYSAIIVTGGLTMASYFDNDGDYLNGSYLIKKADVPILGICLGNQIIGRLYGSGLVEFEQRGWSKINKLEDDPLLKNVPDTFNAWQNHTFVLSKVPDDFELLCDGKSGSIQMIRHRELPIYGVMFHPESGNGLMDNHGKIVLENFVELVKENSIKRANGGDGSNSSEG